MPLLSRQLGLILGWKMDYRAKLRLAELDEDVEPQGVVITRQGIRQFSRMPRFLGAIHLIQK
jgi:hypothetical protein